MPETVRVLTVGDTEYRVSNVRGILDPGKFEGEMPHAVRDYGETPDATHSFEEAGRVVYRVGHRHYLEDSQGFVSEISAENYRSLIQALEQAVDALAAVKVGRDRYAFHAGRWHSATAKGLVMFHQHWEWDYDSREEAALRYERSAPEEIVEMPSWWTPEAQTVERGIVPYKKGEYTYYPLRNASFHGCAASTIQQITADLETGEEIVVERDITKVLQERQKPLILNLTQHRATPEQIAAGVQDLDDNQRGTLAALLTFDTMPTPEEIQDRAALIAGFAREEGNARGALAMIGGAPYLMGELERALIDEGIKPTYAFSKREVVEEVVDGAVKKTVVFRHEGFVKPPTPYLAPKFKAPSPNRRMRARRPRTARARSPWRTTARCARGGVRARRSRAAGRRAYLYARKTERQRT